MNRTFIYGLCDPFSGELRYIGKTCQPINKRATAHVQEAGRGVINHRCNWLRSLSCRPVAVLLLDVLSSEADFWERELIAMFRVEGRLTNNTAGGDGAPGRIVSLETRKKMSEARKGRLHSLETKQKISRSKIGRPHPRTFEWNEKISASQRGKPKRKGAL
jgi:hypothetical protein